MVNVQNKLFFERNRLFQGSLVWSQHIQYVTIICQCCQTATHRCQRLKRLSNQPFTRFIQFLKEWHIMTPSSSWRSCHPSLRTHVWWAHTGFISCHETVWEPVSPQYSGTFHTLYVCVLQFGERDYIQIKTVCPNNHKPTQLHDNNTTTMIIKCILYSAII